LRSRHNLMDGRIKKLFTPITINSLNLKNRLMMAPMGLGYTQDSQVNDRIVDFFTARAKGGVGLIDVGACRIHELAGGPLFIGIDDDLYIPGLKRLADAVHPYGTKIIAQLYHPGSSVIGLPEGKQAISSSAVRSGFTGIVPRPLLEEEIPRVQRLYVEAAIRAQKAGWDGVDVIGAAGYLISQFLSPIRNLRKDRYGGSLENRMRFALEIVDRIRGEMGRDFPLFFKMAANEFMEGGNGLSEGKIFARELERTGVDCIITAGGWHETRIPQLPMSVPNGTWLYLASEIKKVVGIPVVACNQIRDYWMAEQVLRDGIADMVGMGRPLLADPELPNKTKSDRSTEINTCISCLQGCFGTPHKPHSVGCLVNPRTGRETHAKIVPTSRAKTVMVVGGGPAGMMAALTAAEKGHRVSLYEKRSALGGQLPMVAAPEDRRQFNRFKEYLTGQIRQKDIHVRLDTAVTPDDILASRPDAVIVATGAKIEAPSIPGVDLPHVCNAWDVLRDVVDVGEKIVVIGGGATGCETALHLAAKGCLSPEALHYLFLNDAEDVDTLKALVCRGVKQVTLIEMLPKIGRDIHMATRWSIINTLKRRGVRIIAGAEVTSIDKETVAIIRDGKAEAVDCDSVVLATGVSSDDTISDSIKDRIEEVYVIGDALEPRQVLDAVHEGFKVAGKL
jgi:2,4-dienoyl-CoA reductase (NADPH2)